MDIILILKIAGMAMFFILVPGPGMAAMLSYALARPWRNTMMLLLGIRVGDGILLALVLLGLTTLANSYESAFKIISFMGALYLLWIGFQLFRSPDIQEKTLKTDDTLAFLSGFATGIGNPKSLLLYISFMPTILPVQHLSFLSGFIVWLIMLVTYFATSMVLYGSASKARAFIKDDKIRVMIQRTMGAVIIAVALISLFLK